MKFILTAFLFVVVASCSAQCFTLFTLNAIGTDATAVFEGTGAADPLYVVDWGDGQIDTSTVPVLEHSYASDGFYMATYYYFDLDNPNCSYFSFEAFVLTGFSCNLNIQIESIAEAVVVDVFAENTSVPLVSIDWGDGSPELLDNSGIHAYATPGTYEVCVSLVDGDPAFPCQLTECQTVEVLGVQGSCTVGFEPTVQGQEVSLAIAGTGSADAPYWIDWGDGTYSESPANSHTYNVPNYYTICIYYGEPGDIACQAWVCQEIFIDPFASECVLQMVPLVDGSDVQLQVLAAGADAPIYFVDWGDGSDGEFGFPQGYTYGAAGTYLICVSYTDSLNPIGCQLNECQEVTVENSSNPCTVALTVVNGGLENTYAVQAVGEGAALPFYAIAWGDNSPSVYAASGEHAYSAPGAYEICVTYGDSLNPFCNATLCETVNVISSVEEQNGAVFLQASPIPLTDETAISFRLPQPGAITLAVVDVFGRRVATVYTGSAGQETQLISWDSSGLASGLYSLCLTGAGIQQVVSLVK
jgi:hypothetical protein